MAKKPAPLYERYEALIAEAGMSQRGAARFLDVGERTSRRWASGEIDVPLTVLLLLEVMKHHGIDPHEARRLGGFPSKRGDTYSDQRRNDNGDDDA